MMRLWLSKQGEVEDNVKVHYFPLKIITKFVAGNLLDLRSESSMYSKKKLITLVSKLSVHRRISVTYDLINQGNPPYSKYFEFNIHAFVYMLSEITSQDRIFETLQYKTNNGYELIHLFMLMLIEFFQINF